MSKHILITGVAGFIGSNLLDYLIEKTDWKITGIDNFTTGNKKNIQNQKENNRFSFIEGNCREIKSIKDFNCIFHLAALPRIQPSFEFVTEHINENLTSCLHLIELMIKENYFPRFVFSSSSAVYGTPKNIPTTEEEPIDCLNPYAFQKYEVEKYLELLATRYPIDYVNLRYFNPYGNRSFNPENKFNAYSSVIGIFLQRKKKNLALQITGDGSQKRDFIHVYDLAKANYIAATYKEKLNTSFNIGFGDTLSVLQLAKMISGKIEFIEKRQGEAEVTFADISKAKKMLRWSPEHKLKDYFKENL